jgi:hypothetical protein
MTRENHNSLWRDFPRTATEFEARMESVFRALAPS